jgi:hypothetical protein
MRRFCTTMAGRVVSVRCSLQVSSFNCACVIFLCGRSSIPTAFHVTPNDSRVMLREITHGSTVVLFASYSLVMNASDFSSVSASFSPQYPGDPNQHILIDAIAEGFKHLLPSPHGSVFSLPRSTVVSYLSQVTIEGGVILFALNASEPHTFDGWSNLSIAAFQAKVPPSIQNRSILSPQNFKVMFDFPFLFCIISLTCIFWCRIKCSNISCPRAVFVLMYPFHFSCTYFLTMEFEPSPPCPKVKQRLLSLVLCLLCSSVSLLLPFSILTCLLLMHHNCRR